ncbi:hypothetical protein DCAR_0933464 [Daucus carota subsp. sativus]|uniref:Uncharacterized protein n=1 Tax=Daucus carota subsp. sativus TaxID=79200 RepID=A0A175YE67_DAUCS|nr:PREDICTED: uncharacterized protein LOC108200329 [Daucus carota subsp. sativus]WOH13951.1 hypothetical protein DCAR_0933464 [Daucus carota subsp. sativus]
MVANQKSTSVGAVELKAVIYRKIGRQRTEDYFNLLKRYFSLKLKKYEFDKSCIQVIGRNNLHLHNQLIQTILKNSYVGKVPLSRAKNVVVAASPTVKVANGLPVHSRGLANRDRKFNDRPSPLGPLGKSQQSETELLSLGSRPPIEVVSVEDGEEVEQAAGSPCIQSRSPVTAPLGISMYKGARKALCSGNQQKYHSLICQQTRELPDARSLMIILEQKLEMEGLRISVDCANVLNNGLDCYLKRLIEPCIGLAGSRCMKERPQHITGQRVTALNGMLPANGIYLSKPSDSICASLSDFGVVMESNPCILGGDWAVLREKVCAQAFEE